VTITTHSTTHRAPADWMAAVLRGDEVDAPEDVDGVVTAWRGEELGPLLYAWAQSRASCAAWPTTLRGALEEDAHLAAARELTVQRELTRVLNALGAAGVAPLILKGTALAYSIYPSPSLRTRADTDLLVAEADVARTAEILTSLGYAPANFSAGRELFGQAPLVRRDAMGLEHWLDLHWAVSAARVFAEALTYNELDAAAEPVPALGLNARAPGPIHALLLACMHPVMHHRNAERLIWIYDIHLLAGRLDPAAWAAFAALVQAKDLRAVAQQGLQLAQRRLRTFLPTGVLDALQAGAAREPSAAYLAPGRGWLDELGGNLSARPLGAQLRLLREIAFPRPSYMFNAYGLAGAWRWALLPLLYSHRAARGAWRLARGAK
jgi:hypothetical protein